MTQHELSRYYWALSSQADYMAYAIENFESGMSEYMWYSLVRWAEYKHIADEINDTYDNMAFARAIGISNGIRKVWE